LAPLKLWLESGKAILEIHLEEHSCKRLAHKQKIEEKRLNDWENNWSSSKLWASE